MRKNILHASKIVTAAILAILLAEVFQMQFAVSAGIVAILSIAFTKRETIQTARNRFLAFGVALVIAAGCFTLVGYNNYGFFVYLLLFIPVCQFFGWNSAMAMDSVLISHFLSFQNMSVPALVNEIGLFLIGVGIGIGANLFLRKDTDYMIEMKQKTDELMKYALHRMSLRIMDPHMKDYDGSCFESLKKTIAEASAIAHANYMNQLSSKDRADIDYIAMRDKQSDTLYGLHKHLSQIDTVPMTAGLLSDFFERVSEQYSMENTVEDLLVDFEKLNRQMKEMPLPEKRKEFEDRARLFAIMRGMEEFLHYKKEYVMENKLDK